MNLLGTVEWSRGAVCLCEVGIFRVPIQMDSLLVLNIRNGNNLETGFIPRVNETRVFGSWNFDLSYGLLAFKNNVRLH